MLTIQAGRIFSILAFFIFLATLTARNRSVAQESSSAIPRLGERLTDDQAAGLAKLAIASLQREFPNKPGNVITGPESILSPKKMHPAFYEGEHWLGTFAVYALTQ
ncbi:MAG: DUF2891 family protein [Planctomycetota bacterium]|nr:DUF2891 family protein [Planctomycetota bacterium]